MNINIGVIWDSSSGFCVSSVNYVILYKLFRVCLENQAGSLPQPNQVVLDSWVRAPRALQALACLVVDTGYVD